MKTIRLLHALVHTTGAILALAVGLPLQAQVLQRGRPPMPILFIDDYGDKKPEKPTANETGETYHMRQVFAPLVNTKDPKRSTYEIRHKTIGDLTAGGRELLKDARVVVIAGVKSPGGSVKLLREYVEQGGNLVIAAGGEFDPSLWHKIAWDDGLGILPAPIYSSTHGYMPTNVYRTRQRGVPEAFQLDATSLHDDYFPTDTANPWSVQYIYMEPAFYKTVVAIYNKDPNGKWRDLSEATRQRMIPAATRDIQQRRTRVTAIRKQLADLAETEANRPLTSDETEQRNELAAKLELIEPSWLEFESASPIDRSVRTPSDLALRSDFRVLARYVVSVKGVQTVGTAKGLPYLVERRIGQGRALLITSSISPTWNTLANTNAKAIYTNILNRLIADTRAKRRTNEPELTPVTADAGSYVLSPKAAQITGKSLHYNSSRDYLAAWSRRDEYATWILFQVTPGTYAVDITYGTSIAENGYVLTADGAETTDAKITEKTEATGNLRTYKTFRIGRVTLPAGKVEVTLKPSGRIRGTLMNLREIKLTPGE